jgi:hypothetical protein
LFAGTLAAGQRAAAITRLIQSAKLNGHDPYVYLKDAPAHAARQRHWPTDAASLEAGGLNVSKPPDQMRSTWIGQAPTTRWPPTAVQRLGMTYLVLQPAGQGAHLGEAHAQERRIKD